MQRAQRGVERAAERFGFTFEGMFRQHMVVKGRNRDTAWYSIIDTEWPARRRRIRTLARAGEFRCAGPAEGKPRHDDERGRLSALAGSSPRQAG